MSRQHATDHEIYRKRGATNVLIGALLLAVVVLIAAGTVFKMHEQADKNEAALAEQSEVQTQ